MPVWGRRIAGRKLEDDELFQQIGGQLEAVQFDYTKWQRTSEKEEKSSAETFVVASGAKAQASKLAKPASQQGISSKALAQMKEIDAQRAERIRMLKLRILAHQTTLKECQDRVDNLQKDNHRLMEEIQGHESKTHINVEKLLRNYDRYQCSMMTMKDHFTSDLATAQNDLLETKVKTERELADLQKKVDSVDAQLAAAQEEFSLLSGYKDKEYSTKMLQILELQREIETIKLEFKEADKELSNIINAEREKISKSGLMDEVSIRQRAAKDIIDDCPNALVEMALQNKAMERDIARQEQERVQLEAMVIQMTEKVQALLRNPKSDLRQQLFPQFYPDRPVCTPDMDVVLNIPLKEWLPI